MKISFIGVTALSVMVFGRILVQAQNVPAPVPFHIVRQDGNSRTWERDEYEQTPDGHIATHKRTFEELEAGVNFWSGDQWTPSSTTRSSSYGYLDGELWNPQIWSSALPPVDIANLYFNQNDDVPWP